MASLGHNELNLIHAITIFLERIMLKSLNLPALKLNA